MLKTIKQEDKANFLLDKGIEVLWSKGYNGTSVNDIVKAADVPKGSFYFYFDSKEDFAAQAIDRYFRIITAQGFEILEDPNESSALKRLTDFFTLKCKIIKEQHSCTGCMACNVTAEMAEHSELIRVTVVKNETEFKNRLIAVFEEAQQLGEIDSKLNANDTISFIDDSWKGAMLSSKSTQDYYAIDNVLKFTLRLLQ